MNVTVRTFCFVTDHRLNLGVKELTNALCYSLAVNVERYQSFESAAITIRPLSRRFVLSL